jgi:hypothetical protein
MKNIIRIITLKKIRLPGYALRAGKKKMRGGFGENTWERCEVYSKTQKFTLTHTWRLWAGLVGEECRQLWPFVKRVMTIMIP